MERKEFPDDFSDDAAGVLEDMTFGGKATVMGSMGLRDQLYAGDYDLFETVNVVHLSVVVKKFQSIVGTLQKRKNCYIGDIKSGIVPKWDVLRDLALKDDKVVGYDHARIVSELNDMYKHQIISASERNASLDLLKVHMKPADYYLAKDEIKFHIVRWTASDVLDGSVTLRDGNKLTLADAFKSPSITKLDVIAWVSGNRYSEFSAIYRFVKGKEVLNPTPSSPADIRKSILESMGAYRESGNYFKVLKRYYSLARMNKDTRLMALLTPILNSDLGRLSLVITDINTLQDLLEMARKFPTEKARFEIDQFIARLSNVSLPSVAGRQHTLNAHIRRVQKLPPAKMEGPLEKLKLALNDVLQKYAKPFVDNLPKLTGGGGGPDVWGPPLWAKIHATAARGHAWEFTALLEDLVHTLPCPICRPKLAAYLKEHPIVGDLEKYASDLHNDVNRRLGKEVVPFVKKVEPAGKNAP